MPAGVTIPGVSDLSNLLKQNREWAARMERERPGFFGMLRSQQRPRYLWIGCSDSRVPANEIVDLPPGEVFVHRNVANLVVHSDLNALSTIEFATRVLGVTDIIVCGHYGCGGITAALQPVQDRIVDHWLRHVRDIAKFYREELEAIEDPEARNRRLCELNVAVQVVHVQESPVIIELREKGHDIRVHGWIYDVGDGLLRDITGLVEKVRAREPGCA
jgi:carbonic anhydrase